MKANKAAIGVAVAVILFLLLVWPTPYQIYKHPKGQAYRVNRFSGVTEYATPGGWKRGYLNSEGMFREIGSSLP